MQMQSGPDNLTRRENIWLIFDFFHRTMMHHAMWFAEVQHQLGREKALKAMEEAWSKSFRIQMERIAKTLDVDLVDSIPQSLLELPDQTIEKLRDAMAVNWLANDGVWFQAVEFSEGMNDAKRCNDSCWGQFSPFEAWSVKRMLKLPGNPGLEGLKKALQLRLYAFINEQSFAEEKSNSFIFRMDQCRVQNARKRKGLPDYPCQSGGMIEYKAFAEAIDQRIKTECICCPPDEHPDDYFCAWRFSLDPKS